MDEGSARRGSPEADSAPGAHVLVLGAAGMLGRRLSATLARAGRVGERPITRLTLADITTAPLPPAGPVGSVQNVAVDLATAGTAAELVAARPDVVFDLAAVVSGQAEADFDLGYRVNLDATRWLFEALRAEGADTAYRPRVVFTSSIAVFGPPLPARIGDDYLTTPASSYGTQKAIAELLLGDYSRRGFLDGVGLRLPTVCVRPGTPNRAASGFFSNIMREPLVGEPAVLPVAETVRHWFTSPRSAVGFLEHAAAIDTDLLGLRRTLNMPGVSATVAEQIDALRRLAGQKAVDLIRHEPDPVIAGMVSGWPEALDARRALDLGFVAEDSFDDILRAHVEDELGGHLDADLASTEGRQHDR